MTEKITGFEAPEESKLTKIKTFVKKNKMPLFLTATAVAGLSAGYVLRDKKDEILDETSDLLVDVADRIETVSEDINNKIEE